MAQRTRKPAASRNGSSAIAVSPDPLTDTERAVMVANALKRNASQRLDLELVRVQNGHSEGEVIPGAEPFTYAARLAEIDEQAARVRAAWPELVDRVNDLLRGQGG